MADNTNLGTARQDKKDEFYTQYKDIEAEMNAYIEYNPNVFSGKTILLPCDDPEWSDFTKYFAANFTRLHLKKLISTSYAKGAEPKQLSLFDDPTLEEQSPLYDEEKHNTKGKLYILSGDKNKSGLVDSEDVEFTGYLNGTGDFRSPEVCKLRDEADIIITNPPFSLFREFLHWILEAKKKFIIIGNQNAITYKEVFPLLKNNEIWLGNGFQSNVGFFRSPYEDTASASNHKKGFIRVSGVMWFTNIDLAKRHEILCLDTMEHNLKYNKKLINKLKSDFGNSKAYPHYDNYDAIEIPFTECIPSDYDGVMGVPITFMDKYNPEQFEILGADGYDDTPPTKTYPNKQKVVNGVHMKSQTGALGCTVRIDSFGQGTCFDVGYPIRNTYKRIFIKAKRNKR